MSYAIQIIQIAIGFVWRQPFGWFWVTSKVRQITQIAIGFVWRRRLIDDAIRSVRERLGVGIAEPRAQCLASTGVEVRVPNCQGTSGRRPPSFIILRGLEFVPSLSENSATDEGLQDLPRSINSIGQDAVAGTDLPLVHALAVLDHVGATMEGAGWADVGRHGEEGGAGRKEVGIGVSTTRCSSFCLPRVASGTPKSVRRAPAGSAATALCPRSRQIRPARGSADDPGQEGRGDRVNGQVRDNGASSIQRHAGRRSPASSSTTGPRRALAWIGERRRPPQDEAGDRAGCALAS